MSPVSISSPNWRRRRPARVGRGAIALHADVSRAAEVNRAARQAIDAFGRVDIVVNNAGTTHRNKPLIEVTEDEFDRVFAVNVKSIFLTAQAFLPHMRANGGGVFVNIGSTAGLRPRPGLTVYNSSKGAVHVMTKSMAVELAPDKIRVCALAPVAGETPLLAMFLGEDTPEKRAAFRATRAARPLLDAARTSARPRCSWPATRRISSPAW